MVDSSVVAVFVDHGLIIVVSSPFATAPAGTAATLALGPTMMSDAVGDRGARPPAVAPSAVPALSAMASSSIVRCASRSSTPPAALTCSTNISAAACECSPTLGISPVDSRLRPMTSGSSLVSAGDSSVVPPQPARRTATPADTANHLSNAVLCILPRFKGARESRPSR